MAALGGNCSSHHTGPIGHSRVLVLKFNKLTLRIKTDKEQAGFAAGVQYENRGVINISTRATH